MDYKPENPIIVQGDKTVLLEVHSPLYEQARDGLARFAELVKSPEHIHTYRITPLSIWNAVAAGFSADEAVSTLESFAKYDIPAHVITEIKDYAGRYGRIKLEKDGDRLKLSVSDIYLAEELYRHKVIFALIAERSDKTEFKVLPINRGLLKQELIRIGWPAEDLAGYVKGEKFEINLNDQTSVGAPFKLRDYQQNAVDIFHAGGGVKGGSGVVVMPCGAGKTIIGIGTMACLDTSTLIITTSTTALRQWREELIDKTSVTEDDVGEYSGFAKDIAPITITTYQMLTHRKSKQENFEHFELFNKRKWGLIVYDEVHVLPAPVFMVTAQIQATRRLGLTATLVREDGKEEDVFALIGPKRADVPWKVLEDSGWIAPAICREVRLTLPEELKMEYAIANNRDKFRIASENSEKLKVVEKLLEKHQGESTLVIGQYLSQLEYIAEKLDAPLLTGKTKQSLRDELFKGFKDGEIKVLVVSKVANFAVDLPDARVAIQVSGTFGSRQEEAQRLGRILRPKEDGGQATFYTLVTRDTTEMGFAQHRQLFLTEQGYAYEILDASVYEQG